MSKQIQVPMPGVELRNGTRQRLYDQKITIGGMT